MYTFDSVIRYSETDLTRRLTPAALMNYFQDCSTFHSESLGMGFDRLREKNRAWMISSWQVEIDRIPRFGEKVTIGTKPYAFQGMFGKRNFAMLDERGEFLVKANSLWVYMDIVSGRPARLDAAEIAGYPIEEPLEMNYEARKIRLPEEMTESGRIPVTKQHLDGNRHVNNVQYIAMAADLLPEEADICQLRVEYKKQARLGDMICLKTGQMDGNRIISLCDEEGNVFAIVSFGLR